MFKPDVCGRETFGPEGALWGTPESGLGWAAVLNSRNQATGMVSDPDRLMWKMARVIPAWNV